MGSKTFVHERSLNHSFSLFFQTNTCIGNCSRTTCKKITIYQISLTFVWMAPLTKNQQHRGTFLWHHSFSYLTPKGHGGQDVKVDRCASYWMPTLEALSYNKQVSINASDFEWHLLALTILSTQFKTVFWMRLASRGWSFNIFFPLQVWRDKKRNMH